MIVQPSKRSKILARTNLVDQDFYVIKKSDSAIQNSVFGFFHTPNICEDILLFFQTRHSFYFQITTHDEMLLLVYKGSELDLIGDKTSSSFWTTGFESISWNEGIGRSGRGGLSFAAFFEWDGIQMEAECRRGKSECFRMRGLARNVEANHLVSHPEW